MPVALDAPVPREPERNPYTIPGTTLCLNVVPRVSQLFEYASLNLEREVTAQDILLVMMAYMENEEAILPSAQSKDEPKTPDMGDISLIDHVRKFSEVFEVITPKAVPTYLLSLDTHFTFFLRHMSYQIADERQPRSDFISDCVMTWTALCISQSEDILNSKGAQYYWGLVRTGLNFLERQRSIFHNITSPSEFLRSNLIDLAINNPAYSVAIKHLHGNWEKVNDSSSSLPNIPPTSPFEDFPETDAELSILNLLDSIDRDIADQLPDGGDFTEKRQALGKAMSFLTEKPAWIDWRDQVQALAINATQICFHVTESALFFPTEEELIPNVLNVYLDCLRTFAQAGKKDWCWSIFATDLKSVLDELEKLGKPQSPENLLQIANDYLASKGGIAPNFLRYLQLDPQSDEISPEILAFADGLSRMWDLKKECSATIHLSITDFPQEPNQNQKTPSVYICSLLSDPFEFVEFNEAPTSIALDFALKHPCDPLGFMTQYEVPHQVYQLANPNKWGDSQCVGTLGSDLVLAFDASGVKDFDDDALSYKFCIGSVRDRAPDLMLFVKDREDGDGGDSDEKVSPRTPSGKSLVLT